MATDIAAVLTASITDFKAKLDEAEAKMKVTTESGSSGFQKLSSIGKGAMLGIGAAVVTVGVAAVEFGDKLEASQAQLQASLKAAGISWDSVKGSVSATGDAATRFGFTQAQIDAALSQGIISTQNYASAHRNLQIAIELAAARHTDLASAMQAVDKAATGQLRPLKQLGIDLPVVASNALKVKQAQEALQASQLVALSILDQYPGALDAANKHHAAYETAINKVAVAQHKLSDLQNAHIQILDALSQRLKGQAAAAADTFAGRIAAVKAQGENLVANLGMALIPVLERVITIVMNVVTWFEHHKAAAIALAAVIGGALVTAIGAWIASMVTATATIGGMEIALAPIAVAVGGLVVAIVLLATHWTQVWSDIKSWTDDAVAFLRDHFYILMGIPLVGWMLALAVNWQTVWSTIKAVINDAWTVIGPIFGFIKTLGIDVISAAITGFQGVWNTAWSVVQTVLSGAWTVVSPIVAAINLAISGVQTAIGALETVWNTVWGAIASAVQAAWTVIGPIISGIETAASAVGTVINAITGSGSAPTPNSGKSPTAPGTAPTPGRFLAHAFLPTAAGDSTAGFSAAGTTAGGGAGALVLNLNVNGQTFATATVNDIWAALLQKQRSAVTLNLT